MTRSGLGWCWLHSCWKNEITRQRHTVMYWQSTACAGLNYFNFAECVWVQEVYLLCIFVCSNKLLWDGLFKVTENKLLFNSGETTRFWQDFILCWIGGFTCM